MLLCPSRSLPLSKKYYMSYSNVKGMKTILYILSSHLLSLRMNLGRGGGDYEYIKKISTCSGMDRTGFDLDRATST